MKNGNSRVRNSKKIVFSDTLLIVKDTFVWTELESITMKNGPFRFRRMRTVQQQVDTSSAIQTGVKVIYFSIMIY